MALNQDSPSRHVTLRLIGLTGLLTLAVGLIVYFSVPSKDLTPGQKNLGIAGLVLAILGGLGLIIWLVSELKGFASAANSRRGAAGANVALQLLLAVALVCGVNIFSFYHYERIDWTREQIFSIPKEVRTQLAQLRGETDIVVFLRHASFGQLVDHKQDNFDAAAERQIVEKVRDLAELFQELGPRFRVQILDIQEDNYQAKLNQIKEKSPALAEAIEKASENSIFFQGGGKVQRLAFHDVYQLDRVASKTGEGNLVLNYQGVGPFANKVLNIEAKTPRVGVAVIHPVLSLNDADVDFYSMNGAKKVFEAQGFDTVDIILKKGWEEGNPEATAYTFDENQFEILEEEKAEIEETVKRLKKAADELSSEKALFGKSTKEGLAEINEKYIYLLTNQGFRLFPRKFYDEQKKTGRKIETSHVDEKDRVRELNTVETELALVQVNLEKFEPELENLRKQQAKLKVENLEEQRRITDTKAKLSRLLAECDLLILPRQTLIDVPQEKVVPNRVHRLDDAQFLSIKEFMKSGKPVLFCLGPSNEPARGLDPSSFQPDSVEDALKQMGFELPKQTILYGSEVKSFAQRRGGLLIQGSTKVDLPPVEFDWKKALGLPGKLSGLSGSAKNPVRTSVVLTNRSLGKSKDLDMRVRYPRPVFYLKTRFTPEAGASLVSLLASPNGWTSALAIGVGQTTPQIDESSVVMVTDPDSWNEDNPFPSRDRTPRFEPAKPDDPSFGTLEEKRRGPFPIAVAANVDLPESWFGDDQIHKDRIAVVGSGGAFVGKNLTPVQQKLLLDLSNWLLGRDDLLARSSETWRYPRVMLSDTASSLWQWGTRLGLPLFFVYLGLIVGMVRRVR